MINTYTSCRTCEHAIVQKIALSGKVDDVIVAPGNRGTAVVGGKITNIATTIDDVAGLVALAKERQVTLVIVGPE